MKFLVFGASGGVGKQFISQALARQDEVVAFIRDPDKLSMTHFFLTMVVGDAFNQRDVESFLNNQPQDAVVISCLNTPLGLKKSTELSTMLKHIVKAMKQNRLARIIYCASAGVDHELLGEQGQKAMQLLHYPLKDHQGAIESIKNADLDYTIVRPVALINDDRIKPYQELTQQIPINTPKTISRSQVADFMLKAAHNKRYLYQSIGLANQAVLAG